PSLASRRPPRSTLFPCTTLFRSVLVQSVARGCEDGAGQAQADRGGAGPGLRVAPVHDVLGVVLAGRPLSRVRGPDGRAGRAVHQDRKSTRLNSSHVKISYAVFCL